MYMRLFALSLPVNIALLMIRLIFGLLMAGHGAQKLFGWFGGYGIAGTGGWFESIGYKPGRLFAALSGLSEFGGGLLIAIGLLGPVGPALLLSVMIVAVITVHRVNGLFAATNGVEVPLLYIAVAGGLALTGYGKYSLDWATHLRAYWTPNVVFLIVLLGILGGLGNVLLRNPPPAPPA